MKSAVSFHGIFMGIPLPLISLTISLAELLSCDTRFQCFFNLFAAAEPSTNIYVAHGTLCNDPSVCPTSCNKRISSQAISVCFGGTPVEKHCSILSVPSSFRRFNSRFAAGFRGVSRLRCLRWFKLAHIRVHITCLRKGDKQEINRIKNCRLIACPFVETSCLNTLKLSLELKSLCSDQHRSECGCARNGGEKAWLFFYRFDVEPRELRFSVSNARVTHEKSFEVTGFSVQGRVLDGKNGKPVKGGWYRHLLTWILTRLVSVSPVTST